MKNLVASLSIKARMTLMVLLVLLFNLWALAFQQTWGDPNELESLTAIAVLTAASAALAWWIIRAQLLPLQRASHKLSAMSTISHPVKPLKICRQDEVGTLLGSVNQLIQTIDAHETALRLSEARFRQLIEWTTEAILVHRHGTILYVNPSAIRLLAAPTAQDLLNRPLLDLIHPDFHELVQSRLSSVLEEESEAPLSEQRYIRIDGKVIDVEVQSKSIEYDGLPAIFSALRDITQHKRADESLRIAATAFESNQGTCITDINGHILRVNKAFSKITGYMPEDVIGKSPALLQSGRQDRNFYQMMWQCLEQTGSWQGEIWNRRKNGEIYPEWLNISAVKDRQGKTSHYVGTFNDISAHKQADEKIRNLAFFDPLTELPNRRLLIERLNQTLQTCERKRHQGVLMFVDLDNFKMINDTLGHASGDMLLQIVSRRLTSCVREGDTVARLGGDEFVIMLQDTTPHEKEAVGIAEVVAHKILNVLNNPYKLNETEHHTTPSIGITLFGGGRLESVDEPLKRADLAMYQAKAAGRNTIRFFDPTMQAVVSARAEIETGLREALASKQFVLHYQAQVQDPNILTGAEALIRWEHPARGLISPAEFIPVAEETGLIQQIGEWVLESACQQLVAWSRLPGFDALTISVNVSARQFHQNGFAHQVLDILSRTGAPANRLKLELTESLLVTNVEDIIRKMNLLQEAGVGFALDDFGTGYSSLAYLKRLPLWQLKIDRSFVRDILHESNDAAISRTVVSLANNMGLSVIAEGVESDEQRVALANIGCLSYQGYLYGRPLPVKEFEAFSHTRFLQPDTLRA